MHIKIIHVTKEYHVKKEIQLKVCSSLTFSLTFTKISKKLWVQKREKLVEIMLYTIQTFSSFIIQTLKKNTALVFVMTCY